MSFHALTWHDSDAEPVSDVPIDWEQNIRNVLGDAVEIYRAWKLRDKRTEGVFVSRNVYTVFAAGRTLDGHRRKIMIQGFPCFMGIELEFPDTGPEDLAEFLQGLRLCPFRNDQDKIEEPPGNVLDFVDYIVFAETKVLYTTEGRKPRRIAYLVSRSKSSYSKIKSAFMGGEDDIDIAAKFSPPTFGDGRYINKYDSEISPMYIKMFHTLGIQPCKFITPGQTQDIGDGIELVLDWSQVRGTDEQRNAPMTTLSFDIECEVYSGRFPSPYIKEDTFISTVKKFIRKNDKASNKTLGRFGRHIYGIKVRDEWMTEYPPFKIDRRAFAKKCRKLTEAEADELKKKLASCLPRKIAKRKSYKKRLIPLEGEEITMISAVLETSQNRQVRILISHLPMKSGEITHPRIDFVPEDPGVIIRKTEDEKETIIDFFRVIAEYDVDIVTGWNIFGFDYLYMIKRLRFHRQMSVRTKRGVDIYEPIPGTPFDTVLKKASGIPSDYNGFMPRYRHSETETSAGGIVVKDYIDIPLRVTYDLLIVVRREFNLSSYKLDNVSSEFLVGKATAFDGKMVTGDVPPETTSYVSFSVNNGVFEDELNDGRKYRITDRYEGKFSVAEEIDFDPTEFRKGSKFKWHETKNDVSVADIGNLTRESDVGRYCVAMYCVQDSVLPLRIIKRKQIDTQRIELSNACMIPLEFSYNRAMDAKVFNFYRYFASQRGYVIPRFKDINKRYCRKSYDGAYVFPPDKGVYIYMPKPPHQAYKVPNLVVVLDFASLYPNEEISCNMGHETILSGNAVITPEEMKKRGITVHNFEYNVYTGKKADKKRILSFRDIARFEAPEQFDVSTPEARSKMSVLVQMLLELYAARKRVKKEMAVEKDAELKAILNGKQLAYKLVLNSTYGLTGSSTGRAQLGQIASSTTKSGRDIIHKTAEIIEQEYGKIYRVVYGDTDSVFLGVDIMKIPGAPDPNDTETHKSQQEYELTANEFAMRHAYHMSIEVSKQLGGTRDLELEKGIFPLILLGKKRYIGRYYELTKELKLTNPYIKSMGLETKRRDNAPILKESISKVITTLFDSMDIRETIEETKAYIRQVLSGQLHISKFTISKNLSKTEYANPEAIPHLALALKIKERTGTMPAVNDRINFVFVEIDDRAKDIKQSARVEDPKYALEHGLPIDYGYYLERQLIKPLMKLFEGHGSSVKKEMKKFFQDLLKEEENKRMDRHRKYAGYADIRSFFK